MKLSPIILLLILMVLSFNMTNAQETGIKNKEPTVLKIENPYKKGKTKWLNNNGFETSTYDWSDIEVNLLIDKSLKRRSTGNLLGFTGGGILLLGLYANLVASTFQRESKVINGPYIVGGTLIATSVVLSFNSISLLNKARTAREKKFK